MATKIEEKRTIKSYKIKQSVYDKARKRASRKGTSLAKEIEIFVTEYANSQGYYL